jgi:hypothetical protein
VPVFLMVCVMSLVAHADDEAPVVTSVSPSSGLQGASSLSVTLQGSSFTYATSVSFGAGITVDSIMVMGDGLLYAYITIAAGAAIGPRDVTVSTPSLSGTKPDGFTVVSGTPSIDSVAPNTGRQGESLAVTIRGSNFTSVSGVNFGAEIVIDSFTVDNGTQITADISISPTATVGYRDVIVIAPPFDTTRLLDGFEVVSGGVSVPVVSTESATDVGAAHASLNGYLDDDGGEACEYRFQYWQEGQPRQYTDWQSGAKTGVEFSASVDRLTAATTYHYVAEARNLAGSAVGGEEAFKTGVRLVILLSEGGRVVEPEESVVELAVPGDVAVLAQADPKYVFWCWKGTAADANKVTPVRDPNTTVLVNGDDTLAAAFLPRSDPRDDLNPAPCRGSDLSTSQQWDFGDGAGPQDLYEIGGVPQNGLAPLPGTQLKPLTPVLPENNQYMATDTLWGSDRKGLLALPALGVSLHMWPSMDTATTVRVQCVWHAYDGDEPGSSPVILADQSSAWLIDETALEQGWYHSTYEWKVTPSPEVIMFTLRGQVVVDTLIVDTCTEQTTSVIHVDDDAPLDPGPNDMTVSDPQENGSPEHPFDSIQESIDAAAEDGVVVAHAGRYVETIQLSARNITVTAEWLVDSGILAASILDADGSGPAVSFTGPESVICRLDGLTIVGGKSPTGAAVLCEQASPVISHCLISGNMATAEAGAVIVCTDSQARFINCTISGNRAGAGGAVLSFADCEAIVLNSILWDNDGVPLAVGSGLPPQVPYSDITGGWTDPGVLDLDPLFAAPGYWLDNSTAGLGDDTWVEGDYHLQSQKGRLSPQVGAWVLDPASSPCIDTGDPESPWYQEWQPNGGRANLGTYGGTSQASKSP